MLGLVGGDVGAAVAVEVRRHRPEGPAGGEGEPVPADPVAEAARMTHCDGATSLGLGKSQAMSARPSPSKSFWHRLEAHPAEGDRLGHAIAKAQDEPGRRIRRRVAGPVDGEVGQAVAVEVRRHRQALIPAGPNCTARFVPREPGDEPGGRGQVEGDQVVDAVAVEVGLHRDIGRCRRRAAPAVPRLERATDHWPARGGSPVPRW